MTEKKAKEKTDEPVDLEAINKKLNDLEAKLRRYGANWKRFANIFIGDHNDGEVK